MLRLGARRPEVSVGESIQIRNLCYLLWQHYDYAAFTDLESLDGFDPRLNKGLTPKGALFFTKLQHDYLQNDRARPFDDSDGLTAVPELYNAADSNHEIWNVLENKNIIFANVKMDSKTFLNDYDSYELRNVINAPDTPHFNLKGFEFGWNLYKGMGYKGIAVINPNVKFHGFETPTVAVWDKSALENFVIFKHCHWPAPDIRYYAESIDSSSPETAVTVLKTKKDCITWAAFDEVTTDVYGYNPLNDYEYEYSLVRQNHVQSPSSTSDNDSDFKSESESEMGYPGPINYQFIGTMLN